jgi:threonine dehydrogenase-like Zn-dependent dehydrogenase
MQWHTVREPHLGLTLEERDLDLAIGTMLLTCALSMLEISGIEGGDIALVNGDGAFAAALMCVAHMQGAKCVQTLSASQPPRTGANCFLDLNNASWRRTLLDTDQKMRGRIVFFDLTGDPQEIASILPNLGKLGKLVLCRQDKPTKLLFNAYRDIHRTSVEVRSWKLMPGTSSFDTLPQAYRRAQQLIKWRKDVLSHLLTNLTQYFPMYSNSP